MRNSNYSVCLSIVFAAALLFVNEYVYSQTPPKHDILERLGRGVNMGNAFEAPAEAAWGNPWKPEYFEMMADMGFQHVRVPIRWEPADRSMANAPYTLSPTFLNRIEEVVNTALTNKLHVIINMHHHEALFENPAAQKARFLSQWNQIATHFKDYSDSLLFEVLNEPHGNIDPGMWNIFFSDALSEIRSTNLSRWVLMGTAEFGGLSGVSKLQLPDDNNIILSVHYYNPFNFTHQGADWAGDDSQNWLGTRWRDTEEERETIRNEFAEVLQFSIDHNIPLHVGEFGAYSTADAESREKWTTFLSRWLEEKNLSWAYWEFSAGFGVYNPANNTFVNYLTDALFHNPMPQPSVLPAVTVYASNFNTTNDGWSLSTNSASASLSRASGTLQVAITNGGSQTWHVQLIRGNILLKEGSTYRVSFKAFASANRTATFYLGRASDPWNAYSSYNGINLTTVEKTFTFTFTMAGATDAQARFVFDLGNSTAGISLKDVKLEELLDEDPDPVTGINLLQEQPDVYPNPVKSKLMLSNIQNYNHVIIYSTNGKILSRESIHVDNPFIDLSGYPSGMLLIRLEGANVHKTIKVIKE